MELDRRASTSGREHEEPKSARTLGSLLLRHKETNEIILVPTPSSDPKDPLTWSQTRKYYICSLVCFVTFIGGYLLSAPAVQIVALATQFGDGDPRHIVKSISDVSYFISACSLAQGIGKMIWMPLANKYGRRPVYIFSWSLSLCTAVWSAVATSYSSELAARVSLGFTAGASECLAPVTLAEIFFLHERGKMMGFVIFSLASGTSCGIILGGLITIHLPWQYLYWVSIPFIAATLLLTIFTFPETSFKRDIRSGHNNATSKPKKEAKLASGISNHVEHIEEAPVTPTVSYWHSIRVFSESYTNESIFKMTVRPLLAIALPPILFATLVMGVNIGVLVIVSSNQPRIFSDIYGFESYQSGLFWISGVIGSLVGIFCGGRLSDLTADLFTRRNGGVREPEMRLPALLIPCIFGPLSLILYGFGIYYKWHWMIATLGLGFLCFSVVVAATISTTYTVDSYRPIAGETVVTKMAFKAIVGFILANYGTYWINDMGYRNSFGSMAGIYALVILPALPMFFWGRRIRHQSLNWRIMHYLDWKDDRETGE